MVFSEFLMLDFICPILGGMYLFVAQVRTGPNVQGPFLYKTYQSWALTANQVIVWMVIAITMCPSNGTRTFLDTRFAVGRFLHSAG